MLVTASSAVSRAPPLLLTVTPGASSLVVAVLPDLFDPPAFCLQSLPRPSDGGPLFLGLEATPFADPDSGLAAVAPRDESPEDADVEESDDEPVVSAAATP
ncbi:hypothetical protein A5779_15185 [Mycolicibacterium peregrinum]|uniref:Uncharacterized protein n=1 Tax=Mycolicibacterium peregrinum TaxID=43304 RepID=A0A1A0WG39_MYCPR|nr:hypothetical protein A5779_15185 [Mycolicibacterium peregrinum]